MADKQLESLTAKLTILRNSRAQVTAEIERAQKLVDQIRLDMYGSHLPSVIELDDSPEAA